MKIETLPNPLAIDSEATYISNVVILIAVVFNSADQAVAYAQASEENAEQVRCFLLHRYRKEVRRLDKIFLRQTSEKIIRSTKSPGRRRQRLAQAFVAGFPDLQAVSVKQATFLSKNSVLPAIPEPEDVNLKPGQGALRFVIMQTFEMSINNTLSPEEAEICVDQYVDALANILGEELASAPHNSSC